MIEDKRKIRAIYQEWSGISIGEKGVTEITVYQEPGQMGYVNWFAIYKGDFLWQRIDASDYTVEYFE